MLKTLDERIEEYEDLSHFDKEFKQTVNWLKTLREYLEKDNPMKVTKGNLCGNGICPKCEEHMALGVKNFCDKCGQRIG